MRLLTPALDRRTLLRGLGASLALPFLEAMAPSARAADVAARPRRLQFFYAPNGMMVDQFVPATQGADYALTSTLEPLAPFRARFAVLTGLAHRNATALGDPGGAHGRACAAYLTGAHPKPTEGQDLRAGVSIDQRIAAEIGGATPFGSLELGLEQGSALGSCDIGFSCAYTNGLSWRSPTVPLPVTVNPRELFERLFGDGDTIDPESRLAQLRRQTSLLDFVMDDARRLSGRLGIEDRRKLDEYLDATRDVEARIQKATATVDRGPTTDLARPSGIPAAFEDHCRLMIDLQILAMQADLTRVGSLMLGREISNRTYPEIGVPDSHHMLSHHGDDPAKKAKLARINRFHMTQLAYFMRRMEETRDGEATLLDRTLVIAGTGFGDPNTHDVGNLPAIVAGGAIRGGVHVAVPKDTPMSNLHLSAMHLMGVEGERFGDSTGPLRELPLA